MQQTSLARSAMGVAAGTAASALQQGRKSTNIQSSRGAIRRICANLNGTKPGPCGCMSATQDDKTWFVLLKGKRYGPYTFASVLRAVERGVVDPGAWVWCLGWAEWRIAREVPGLFEQELVPAPDHQEEDVDSPDEKDERDEEDDRDELGESGEETSEKAAPDASATSEPLVGRNARIVILSVLTVLVIVVGAGWTAVLLGIIRVKFMF
jgi:hypothetical protein